MWTSANYPHRPNLYFPSPILKYPLYTTARMELIYFNFGPLRWEYAFSKLSADYSFASYWSQSSHSFASRLWYLGRCILLNFLSETRWIWKAVSVASLCRNFISKYVGSCSLSRGLAVEPIFQPSTLLLVGMAPLNAVQLEGPHVPLIQVLFTYSVNCWRGSEECHWSRWKMGSISSSGRKGSAIIFWMNECEPRSWVLLWWLKAEFLHL